LKQNRVIGSKGRAWGDGLRVQSAPSGMLSCGRLDMRILIIILTLMAASGCTSMLLGADVAPAEQRDTEEDERSKKND
jgi:hypothetical protein